MRILADENVAGSVVRALSRSGHDVFWIAEIASGAPDDQVLEIAVMQERLLLTHDKEFAAAAARKGTTGLTGVILLRLASIGPNEVDNFVARAIDSRSDWIGRFSILKPKTIRMRRLI